MTRLEDDLRSSLRALDGVPMLDADLERRVTAGVRKSRRTRLIVAACGALGIAATATALFAGDGGRSATDPTTGSDDVCAGMRADAAGVSTARPLSLVLSYANEAPVDTECLIDSDVRVVLTAGSVSVTASFEATPERVPGQTTNDSAAVLYMTWRNWCADGPVAAETTFRDGTTVMHDLAAGSATPRCDDPDAPAELIITRATTADVMDPSPTGSASTTDPSSLLRSRA